MRTASGDSHKTVVVGVFIGIDKAKVWDNIHGVRVNAGNKREEYKGQLTSNESKAEGKGEKD